VFLVFGSLTSCEAQPAGLPASKELLMSSDAVDKKLIAYKE
jgi:hypothetical protein